MLAVSALELVCPQTGVPEALFRNSLASGNNVLSPLIGKENETVEPAGHNAEMPGTPAGVVNACTTASPGGWPLRSLEVKVVALEGGEVLNCWSAVGYQTV